MRLVRNFDESGVSRRDLILPDYAKTVDDYIRAHKAPFSAIVFIDEDNVVAVDSDGKTIDEGDAGVDDASVINSVLSGASENYVIAFFGDFTIDTTLSVPDKRVLLECGGAKFKAGSSNLTLFEINQPSTRSATGSKLRFNNFYIDMNGKTGCTVFHVKDTCFAIFDNCKIVDSNRTANNNIGWHFENIDYWCESNKLLRCIAVQTNIGIKLTKTGTSASFGQSHFELEADSQYSIYQDTGASLYKSYINTMFWLYDNCTGWYIDGSIARAKGWIRGEGKGTPINTYLLEYGSNADVDVADISIYTAGNFTDVIKNTGNKIYRIKLYGMPLLLKQAATSIEVGVNNTYGSATEVKPATGIIIPMRIQMYTTGVSAGETLAVKVVATYNDGTTSEIEKTAAAGSNVSAELTNTELHWDMAKTDKYIHKLDFYAKSDQASTTATAYFRLGAIVGL